MLVFEDSSRCIIAVGADGAVYTWGSNQYGQLGHGTASGLNRLPQYIQTIRCLHFVKIAAGGSHSCALTVSGALFGWGRNRYATSLFKLRKN